MVIKFSDTSITNGAVLWSDRSSEQTRATKSPTGRIKVIPLASLRQLHDGAEPLLLGDDDDARIWSPAFPKVVPEKTGKAEIDRGRQRTHVLLQK